MPRQQAEGGQLTLRADGAAVSRARSCCPAWRRAHRLAPKRSQRAGLARRYDCLLDPILASTYHEVKVRSLNASDDVT
jgi:hypothetical protein